MDSPKHMELKNRIKAVCVIFKLSVREFERECQLNRGNISNMTGALGSDKISKIIARYPSINLYWLQNEQLRLQNDQLRLLDEMIERIKNKGKVL